VDANLAGFADLLQPFESVPFDDGAAGQYGAIRTILERAGNSDWRNDLMIAAIALRWISCSRRAISGNRTGAWIADL